MWLLILGFLLTSVLGGALGYLFQDRAWKHQHESARRDNEREQALRTFEEVSTRMDKRLYRMQRLYWAVSQRSRGTDDQAQWESARADYRAALYEWNDNLNRTLALVQTYFGGAVRADLEDGVFEDFAALGRAMTHLVRAVSIDDGESMPLSRFGKRLGHLSRRVYRLNVRMLAMLEDGSLGSRVPRDDARGRALGEPQLELGAHGSAVHVLQQQLRDAGQAGVPIDGDFGPKTLAAVLSQQRSRNLDVDGIVGPRTWASL